MPERARTDLWEPQGSNPLGPPGPNYPGTSFGQPFVFTYLLDVPLLRPPYKQAPREDPTDPPARHF